MAAVTRAALEERLAGYRGALRQAQAEAQAAATQAAAQEGAVLALEELLRLLEEEEGAVEGPAAPPGAVEEPGR